MRVSFRSVSYELRWGYDCGITAAEGEKLWKAERPPKTIICVEVCGRWREATGVSGRPSRSQLCRIVFLPLIFLRVVASPIGC